MSILPGIEKHADLKELFEEDSENAEALGYPVIALWFDDEASGSGQSLYGYRTPEDLITQISESLRNVFEDGGSRNKVIAVWSDNEPLDVKINIRLEKL